MNKDGIFQQKQQNAKQILILMIMIMHQDCAVIPYFGATFGEEFDRANAGDVGLFGASHTVH